MRLPAALSPLFPPAAAPADEAALDQHLDDTALFYGRGCALTLNLLHLLFWPTDRWLLPHDPAVYWTMCWFRAGTFAVHSLYLAALLAPALRRRPLPVLAVAVACSSALFGAAMAQMGGLDRPYFYLTYLAPMGIGAVPARPLRRLLLSPACGLVLCLAYFAARPSELGSVRFGAAVGCMAFVLVVSQIIGHGMFLLARRAFLMGRALDRSRSMLKEYSEHLEDKMAAAAAARGLPRARRGGGARAPGPRAARRGRPADHRPELLARRSEGGGHRRARQCPRGRAAGRPRPARRVGARPGRRSAPARARGPRPGAASSRSR